MLSTKLLPSFYLQQRSSLNTSHLRLIGAHIFNAYRMHFEIVVVIRIRGLFRKIFHPYAHPLRHILPNFIALGRNLWSKFCCKSCWNHNKWQKSFMEQASGMFLCGGWRAYPYLDQTITVVTLFKNGSSLASFLFLQVFSSQHYNFPNKIM